MLFEDFKQSLVPKLGSDVLCKLIGKMSKKTIDFQITFECYRYQNGSSRVTWPSLPCRTVIFLIALAVIISSSNVNYCNGEEYFLDEDEHSITSLETGKVPKIPPEIRVLAKHGEFHKTIYDLPNTETVLRETRFQLDPYDFAHWNDTHHSNGWERSHSGKINPEEYHPAVTTNIYLECTSFYPVEWVYEGDGVSAKITN